MFIKRIKDILARSIEYFFGILFPRGIRCMYCHDELFKEDNYSLCKNCINKMELLSDTEFESCRICGKSLGDYYGLDICVNCNGTIQYFDRGIMISTYNDCSRKLIFDLKYDGKTFISFHFGEMIVDRLYKEELLEEFDFIIPVPIHKKRLKERGFNQAELIGRYIEEGTGIILQNSLVRIENTVSQNKIGKEFRKANVENVFNLITGYENLIYGKSVLLVDDIYTTGATVNECSRVLKSYGVSKVYVVAVASGEN